jgi:chitin disaccharide deacetylase
MRLSPIILGEAASVGPREHSAGRGNSCGLIVNADDWGRDRVTTERALDCWVRGAISTVSAMVFMEDSERAAKIARERQVGVGLHLNLTTPFSASSCPARLAGEQQRIARWLLRYRLAQIPFYPNLIKSFRDVVSAQIDEFCRIYGEAPKRFDGHHHMHLCTNVLASRLLPRGAIVRRSFSFEPGEKGLTNRLYRRVIDQIIARRYRLTDHLLSLAPLQPASRMDRIFSLAQRSIVELETHPVNPQEYRFLAGGEIFRRAEACTLASYETLVLRGEG